jgi:uncharacterized integral membrane protein (TIGR00698 family)
MSWFKELVTREDWWSVWVGFALLASVFAGMVSFVPEIPRWSSPLSGIPTSLVLPLLLLMLGTGVLTTIAIRTLGDDAGAYVRAFPAVFVMATVAFYIAANRVLAAYGLGYALWALLLGLVISNFIGTPNWLRPAARTELFIKIGLVILGAEVVFGRILELGQYGLIVAWGVTPIVLLSMFWLGFRKLGLPPSFAMVIAAATSVCGVSAAIAVAGACRARKEELTLAVGMTLIFTVLMMVGMPFLAQALGLDPIIAGAWIGGTVDSTGAVVASGQILGDDAMQTAAVVKMIQNILIGIIAFGVALYWVARIEPGSGGRPQVVEIWNRFPKFVLGFIGASLIVSFFLVPLLGADEVDRVIDVTSDYRSWFFCLAFLSIGLESDFRQLGKQMGSGKPLLLYLVGQTFNVLLTLLVVWIVFSGLIFSRPEF